jgi:hypothetical protein
MASGCSGRISADSVWAGDRACQHYFDASLPNQFDAYLWFDETRAVTPLPATPREGVPETYPFGL